MARKVRVFVQNCSQHIILKGLNGLILFQDESDYETFMLMLEQLNSEHPIKIHAYILMPQYFEFLVTPTHADSLSKFMQSLGRKYVGYYNKKYSRTGTLWEGRFKSSLVEDELFLFNIMKYIEKKTSQDYRFSSVGKNLFNKKDTIVSQHELYKKLGFTDDKRLKKYLELFNLKMDLKTGEFISTCLEKQLVTGSNSFIQNIEEEIGMTLTSKNRGRPKKQTQEKRKKMYKNLVVLDKEKHKELKVSPLENLSFAKQTGFIELVANEVPLVGAEFPVVFTLNEKPSLVTIVTLGGDSLAINADNKWITPYVPVFLRKYPFSIAGTKDNPDQKVILIDEDSSLFSKSKGKKLFKKDGGQSETLENAIEFLTTAEKQMYVTQNVAKIIADSGILEDREISVGEGDEKKVLIGGFKVVNKEKLNKLSDDVLANWVRNGIIELINMHLKSLENIQKLFDLAHARQS
ncbi:MAG: SapC family protein [Campylobacterota bacterium]|nr:SapC family protein [Campylobacterota bacterium]